MTNHVDANRSWRWGFLGASRIGARALAPAIRALPGQVLHAVAARDPARAEAYAAAQRFRAFLGGYQDVLDSPEIDLVYIALPNDAHAEWTLRALAAGKHVLCEKPLALNAAEAAAIAAAERKTGRRVMEAFCHLHHPQMARAAVVLATEIGMPRAIDSAFCMTMDNPGDYRWLARHGGGALLDLGCYIVSAARVLLGREPRRVAAAEARRGDVDATMTGMLDFGDGVCLRFCCSMVAHPWQHLEIVGDRGRMHMDWPISNKGRDTCLTVNGRAENFAAVDPYGAMVAHFAACIASGAAFLHGMEASLRQARILDALRVAAETRQWVAVPGETD